MDDQTLTLNVTWKNHILCLKLLADIAVKNVTILEKTQNIHSVRLKMLGLYLYTLIIGHKSCNMLGILNKLKL